MELTAVTAEFAIKSPRGKSSVERFLLMLQLYPQSVRWRVRRFPVSCRVSATQKYPERGFTAKAQDNAWLTEPKDHAIGSSGAVPAAAASG
jgi:hypothetical protein